MPERRGRILATALAATLTLPATAALAQGGTPPPAPDLNLVDKAASDTSIYTFNYGVPTSPALNIVGLSADKMTTLTALKPFDLQLPASVGGGGAESFGFDMAPGWLVASSARPRANAYPDENYGYRLLYKTFVGLAASQGAANATATKATPSKVGVTLSASLLDSSDPFFARFEGDSESVWKSCLKAVSSNVIAVINAPPADAVGAQLNAKLETAREKLLTLKAQKTTLASLAGQIAALRQTEATRLAVLDQQIMANPKLAETLGAIRAQVSGDFDGQIKGFGDQFAKLGDPKALDAQIDQAQQDVDKADKAASDQVTNYSKTVQTTYAKSTASSGVADCATKAALAAQYAPDLEAGVGSLWDGRPGEYNALGKPGTVVWAAYRQSLGGAHLMGTQGMETVDNYWMGGVSVRASWSELLATSNAKTPFVAADTLDVWLGLERLTPTDRFSVQVGYQDRRPLQPVASFSLTRWRYFASYSLPLRFIPGAWLQLGYGDTSNDTAKANQTATVTITFTQPKGADKLTAN